MLARWIGRVSLEHRGQTEAWTALRPQLRAVADGVTVERRAAAGFIELERGHYSFEDHEVFPLAQRLRRLEDLEQLGRVTARRRRLPFPEDI